MLAAMEANTLGGEGEAGQWPDASHPSFVVDHDCARGDQHAIDAEW
jgi:hypothetical protein